MRKINFKSNLRFFTAFITLFMIETFIAIFVHDNFIRPYVGDVLAVIVIYCFLRIFIFSPNPFMPLYIFLFAAFVELAQYFNIFKVLGIDSSNILSVVLGSTFDFKDILCYFVGCVMIFIFSSFYYFSGKQKKS